MLVVHEAFRLRRRAMLVLHWAPFRRRRTGIEPA
jgi:hypothetical protein